MIRNQDLLGMILFGYLLVVSPFSKEANQVKVATALFILDDNFEFNEYHNQHGRCKRACALLQRQLWIQDLSHFASV